MIPQEPPKGWGDDRLTKWLNLTNENAYFLYANQKETFSLIHDVNELFQEATEILQGLPDDELVSALLIPFAHNYFLGGIRLVTGGQLPVTYAVLRGCLENALYAYHISNNPNTSEIWINRNESPEELKKCKATFKPSVILNLLEKNESNLGNRAKSLYEHQIEFGAHPNPRGLLQDLKTSNEVESGDWKFIYEFITDAKREPGPFVICLNAVCKTGLISLEIFSKILPLRFEIIQLTDKIDRLHKKIISLE